MKTEFDPAKNIINIEKHGLSFEDVHRLDWDKAVFEVDNRRNYGETRYIALAPMEGRVHIVCYTVVGDTIRIISFRKANKREVKSYDKRTVYR